MKPDVVVLCYHGLSETWPAATSVTPRHLREQVQMLLRRGYAGATLVDALTAPRTDRTLVVTFDDANRSIAELGRPVLDELGVPATVFVPTDYAGSDRPMGWPGFERWLGTEHEHELRCLSWDALRALDEAGWEIGSHTCSHPRLTQLSDGELRRELRHSRRVIEERLGRPCHSIAYPYSDEDDRVVRAARDAGYALGVTVGTEPQAPLPLRWPRVGVGHGDSARRIRVRIARRASPRVDAAVGAALTATRRAQGLRR